jgi:hypothetical protein
LDTLPLPAPTVDFTQADAQNRNAINDPARAWKTATAES